MATIDPNELFYTAFEPKLQNRFILYVDGIPSYMVKGVSGLGFTNDEITLNHINTYRKIKGKTKWNNINLTLYDPITPSGSQTVMEWARLHHESVTGRDSYSDVYKKDLTINVLGPNGDIVGEWISKGSFILSADFGDYNWDNESVAQNIGMSIAMDYMILNF